MAKNEHCYVHNVRGVDEDTPSTSCAQMLSALSICCLF
jgi:hypothetical protein